MTGIGYQAMCYYCGDTHEPKIKCPEEVRDELQRREWNQLDCVAKEQVTGSKGFTSKEER